MELENINPHIFKKSEERAVTRTELDEKVADPIDTKEIFGELLYFSDCHHIQQHTVHF